MWASKRLIQQLVEIHQIPFAVCFYSDEIYEYIILKTKIKQNSISPVTFGGC